MSSTPPLKPESIATNPAAAAEWDRIVSEIGERGNWEDIVWTRWLEMTCQSYKTITGMTQLLNEHGRGPHTAELADVLAMALDTYHFCVADLQVTPGPLVRLKDLSSGDA